MLPWTRQMLKYNWGGMAHLIYSKVVKSFTSITCFLWISNISLFSLSRKVLLILVGLSFYNMVEKWGRRYQAPLKWASISPFWLLSSLVIITRSKCIYLSGTGATSLERKQHSTKVDSHWFPPSPSACLWGQHIICFPQLNLSYFYHLNCRDFRNVLIYFNEKH